MEKYVSGMEMAIEKNPPPRLVNTVFWGGGTPGILPPVAMERLGEVILRANGGRSPEEWTVEMAPATVKRERLKVLRNMGVNRISMGVQTFQPDMLDELGRIHSLKQVWKAIDLLHEMDFSNFNIDLIFAIPGQTRAMWELDLETALKAKPAHISTYCLTFEEDTALWLRLQRGQVVKTDPDEEAAFFESSWRILGEAGMDQYEVSNYALPGKACRHNIDTWRMQEWLGYGPSASSQFGGRRWTEPHSIEEWLEGLGTGNRKLTEDHVLTPRILMEDSLIFGLRMNEGVDPGQIEKRFGKELPESWNAFQESLIEEGLAACHGSRIALTPAGRLLADAVGEHILELF